MPLPWQQFPTHPTNKCMSCTSSLQDQCMCQVSRPLVEKLRKEFSPQDFSFIFSRNVLLPWQQFSKISPKIYILHIFPPRPMCVQFCVHWSKHEEGVHSKKCFLYFSRNVLLPWQQSSHISEKYVFNSFQPRPMSVPSFVTIGQKLRKEFAPQDFPFLFQEMCRYHGNNFPTYPKNTSCTSSHQDPCVCQVS